jgi:transcriptional regulator with XRE-family HTH domain
MKNKASTWLKKMRTSQNLSFRDLAKRTGLSHTTISNAERGNASADTWITLARYYHTPTENVLNWAGIINNGASERDELTKEIMNYLNGMNNANKQTALDVIKAILKV